MELAKVLKKILDNLPEPFVSEADFQFSLAWELKKNLGKDTEIILEYPDRDKNTEQNKYYDIAIIKQGEKISFIELKYKTKKAKIKRHKQDEIWLKDQQARDFGNYDFIKDIQRMEDVSNAYGTTNYCILLTNDHGYWTKKDITKKNGEKVIDANFKLYESDPATTIKGKLIWDPNEKKHKQKKDNIELKGTYHISWESVAQLKNETNEWKYLLVEIPNQNK